MLLQEAGFPIIIEQQSVRITSMLQQDITFAIGMFQQSMRITSMF